MADAGTASADPLPLPRQPMPTASRNTRSPVPQPNETPAEPARGNARTRPAAPMARLRNAVRIVTQPAANRRPSSHER